MSDKKQAKYRVGVIGIGRAGTSRARAFDIHPLCQVTAIADTDAENLQLGCKRFGVPGYSTYEEMFAKEELEIAMAVLPVNANAGAVIAAAQAGVKAIFCEKPLTASLADADRMVEECRSRGVHIGAGLMVSSHPDYIKAYELVAAGELGQVERINLYGGNDQGGCHGLNLMRKFAGKAPVEWVSGWVKGDAHSDSEEAYEEGETGFGHIGGHIHFANGVECFSHFENIRWKGIEIIGSHGLLYNWNNTGVGLQLFKAEGDPRHRNDLKEVGGVFEEYRVEPREFEADGWRSPETVMVGIVQALIEALEEGKELQITTADDLRHALEIAIAMRQSARQGHIPIKLPLEDRSLVMYPKKMRWQYKKGLLGRESYMEEMNRQHRDIQAK